MVAPAMLQSPAVRKWLGGILPAWTSLEEASFHALRNPPSPANGPIRLAADLTLDELQQSAVARNALILLRAAAVAPGLKTTATGNLSRGVVSQMCDLFEWPEFDKAKMFQFNKVINEPDFMPLYFVRHVAESAKLLRRQKGFLKATPTCRKLLTEPNVRALQAVLFHTALWHLRLGYLGRGLLGTWPQQDIGIVLWSLSVTAGDWQSPEHMTRLCTIPVNGVFNTEWDVASMAMEARILRPLTWFGLVEHRQDDIAGSPFAKHHFYRKTALFDRFLSFDVTLEGATASRH